MNKRTSGYLEIEHTADWELMVWAPDIPMLCEQAAIGMYSLAGARLQSESRITRDLDFQFLDEESLLVDFLTELLFLSEAEGLGFDGFDIHIDGDNFRATLFGAPLEQLSKEIKAVTYHNLKIKKTPKGFQVHIVFDV